MRRFEFNDGTSHKFWEIRVEGETYTVHYGRMGSSGQTATKVFPSAAEAEKKATSMIASKRKKGYAEVEAVAAASTPVKGVIDRLLANPGDAEAWGVLADQL
jgi:predicted DNA-binding WGR domain protein